MKDLITCKVCNITGDKNNKDLFRKNGIAYTKKRKYQKYQCKKCYSIIPGECF